MVKEEQNGFPDIAAEIAEVGREFYARGWVLGTSGNFSAVINRDPLRLAITSSSVDKGKLAAEHILQVDGEGEVLKGEGRPSAETLLHVTVARLRAAGAVLHTHSVWSSILSDAYMSERAVTIEGYEMLKGLEGVSTHEHSERLPVIENSQDMRALARSVEAALNEHPNAHGFLLRRHGLYTWGKDLAEAKRHVEILEFLLEVMGRTSRAMEE
ncbi:MAG TPA: methylthioribulose 1-phosphate dehydratase [Blastocatellia bacterium]|nr:methylthioribulose 1-phosphate dehydratase [Blastocatellia bacterium]